MVTLPVKKKEIRPTRPHHHYYPLAEGQAAYRSELFSHLLIRRTQSISLSLHPIQQRRSVQPSLQLRHQSQRVQMMVLMRQWRLYRGCRYQKRTCSWILRISDGGFFGQDGFSHFPRTDFQLLSGRCFSSPGFFIRLHCQTSLSSWLNRKSLRY